MSRVLLTGASGVVGNAIFLRLKQRHEVIAISREMIPDAFKLDMHEIDAATMKEIAPDIVIHAAWEGSDSARRNNPELLERNAQISMKLLELAVASGAKCWISFGSQAEYSPNLPGDIAEIAPTEPAMAYGRTKLDLGKEQLAFAAAQGMTCYWLRLFSCYSKRQHPPFLLPYLLDCKRRGETPKLSTPQAIEDFLHADDVALGVEKMIESGAESGVYNLAYGEGVSVGDAAKILGFNLPANDAPAKRRVADISKITKACGWKPSISLKDGLLNCL